MTTFNTKNNMNNMYNNNNNGGNGGGGGMNNSNWNQNQHQQQQQQQQQQNNTNNNNTSHSNQNQNQNQNPNRTQTQNQNQNLNQNQTQNQQNSSNHQQSNGNGGGGGGNHQSSSAFTLEQISDLLSHTQSQNNAKRANAEQELSVVAQTYLSPFLLALCHLLSSANETQSVRVAAGLYLKNLVGGESARSAEKLQQIRERWLNESLDIRQQIKDSIIHVLGLPDKEARNTATNVIANLVSVETLEKWPDLIPKLLKTSQQIVVEDQNANFDLLQSVLLCLGRIVEDSATHSDLQPYSSEILQCIAKGMSIPNNLEVNSTAMLCLYYMMDFIRENMTVVQDREVILNMVCVGATAKQNLPLRLNAMMTIARVCELYYELLEQYMPTLFNITKDVIELGIQRKEDSDVCKQAIEVWSVTAEMEAYLNEEHAFSLKAEGHNKENNDSNTAGGPTADPASSDTTTAGAGADGKGKESKSFGFVDRSLNTLVPLYLQALMLQNENFDDDDWDVRKAAACSLELFANVSKGNILSHVLEFVEQHITAANWRQREAALCAFGYVLDGPSIEQLQVLVQQILPIILHMMKDNNQHVQRTSVWTFGRICFYTPMALGRRDVVPNIQLALKESNEVAAKACWAIASLSTFYSENDLSLSQNGHKNGSGSEDPSLYSNAEKTFTLITALLKRTEREDCNAYLVTAVHEALNNIILYAPAQASEMLQSLLPVLVEMLKACVSNELNVDSSDVVFHRIAAILTSIQSSIAKLGDDCLTNELTNAIMGICCALYENACLKNEFVYEEILACITAVSHVIKDNFWSYLCSSTIQKLFLESINISSGQNNSQLTRSGAACIGDAFRSCEGFMAEHHLKMQDFTDVLVENLLKCLLSPEIELEVKSHIVDALVDIAMAFGAFASRYIDQIMSKCLEVGSYETPESARSDEEMMEAFNRLRCSLGDICRAALIIMHQNQTISAFGQYIPGLLTYIDKCVLDGDSACVQAILTIFDEIAHFCDSNTIQQFVKCEQVANTFARVKTFENDAELGEIAVSAYQNLKARQEKNN